MKKLVNRFITTFVVMLMAVLTSVGAKASAGWTVNPADFRYDMSLYFEVAREDGASIDYNLYDVGAFVDGQCRGLSEVVSLPGGGSCLYMRIRSNQESGEWVSFKLREKATQAVTDIENVTVAFKSDDRIGMPSDPFRIVVGAKDSYTVTISAGIGGSVDNVGGQYDEGATLTVTATPDEGYSFAGWSDGNNDATRIITVTGDISLTANFTVNSYKLTYVVDGETYKEQTVEYGTKLTAEAAPIKEGYTFSGWEGLPETMPAHDVTVTGSFIVNSYKLTYVVDGTTYKELTVEYGTKLTAEAAPTKEGYTFSGWEGLPETMPAHDVTVTGSFTVNSYKLTYVVDGAIFKELTVEYGTKLTAEAAPTKEGYTFSGWEGLPETMPAHDVAVTGSFTVNSYKLTYVVDGTTYKELTVEYGSKLTAEAAPTKEGYTFSGWDGLPETMPAHDVTVTGSFTVNSYKLTYVVDGTTYKELTVEYGTKLTAEAAPTKEGYTFSGWEGLPETMPAHDVTVTGSFTVNSYKLTYVIDGETYKEQTVEYGTKLTAEAAPTKEGYTFGGWEGLPETMPAHDVTVTGSFAVNSYKLTYVVDGEIYKELTVEYGTKLTAETAPTKEGYTFSGWEGLPETMPAHDVTVTGSFAVNSYKLTYVVDGEIYKEQTVEYGTKLTAEAAPTKEGYTFSGWEGLPETMPAHDVTVTAVYDVNYYWLRTYVNDNLVYEEEIAYGAKVLVPDPEIGEGYTFNGWAEEVPDVMPAHDVELHALVSVGIDSIISGGTDEAVDVYSIEGQLILHAVAKSQLRNRLVSGLYIISGRKILIK